MKFDSREAIQYHRPSTSIATLKNARSCTKCVCFACNKFTSECTQWQTHCHANTTNIAWRDVRKKLTGDVFVPASEAAPAVKKAPVKAKAAKAAVVPEVPKTVAMSWFGDIYPAETFTFLTASQIGQLIYQNLLETETPSEEDEYPTASASFDLLFSIHSGDYHS